MHDEGCRECLAPQPTKSMLLIAAHTQTRPTGLNGAYACSGSTDFITAVR